MTSYKKHREGRRGEWGWVGWDEVGPRVGWAEASAGIAAACEMRLCGVKSPMT